jgi:hypothetical protein
MDYNYVVKKIMVNAKGKKTHVLLTDGNSEILEMSQKLIAEQLVKLLNENSDSGWVYELVEIKKR